MTRGHYIIFIPLALLFFFIVPRGIVADGSSKPSVRAGKPRIVSISPFNIEFELNAELIGIPRNGRIERLTFHSFTVNGVVFEIDEFLVAFDVKKDRPAELPAPLRCRIKMTDAARKLVRDAIDTKDKWQIDGTVKVYASARKLGFRFKRDINVPVSLKIDNPLPYR